MHKLLTTLALALWVTPALAVTTVTHCRSDTGLVSPSGGEFTLQSAVRLRGGEIVLKCPPGTRMTISRTMSITRPTTIDGGGTVTLDGEGARAAFVVNQGHAFGLSNITLTRMANPQSISISPTGNAVFSSGDVELNNVTVTQSHVPFVGRSFTIQNSEFRDNLGAVIWTSQGTITDSRFIGNQGAALSNWFRPGPASFTIERSQFERNQALLWNGTLSVKKSRFSRHQTPGAPDLSGAMVVMGDIDIAHTDFFSNEGENGGAIQLVAGTLKLRRTKFEDNRAAGTGGAIYIEKRTQHPLFGAVAGGSQVGISYSSFRRNASGKRGGALGVGTDNTAGRPVALSINTTLFAENQAGPTWTGGALYTDSAKLNAYRAIIVGNRAQDGSAIDTGPRPQAQLTLVNSLIARNRATRGAAIEANFVAFVNSTVAENEGAGVSVKEYWIEPGAPALRRLSLLNSLVSNNTRDNCFALIAGEFVNEGGNLQFPSAACGGDIAVADPQLDSYFMPSLISPARGIADLKTCMGDQVKARDLFNEVRPRGSVCAAGAVEGDLERHALRKLGRTHVLEVPEELRELKLRLDRWRGNQEQPQGKR
jgi:predicted outer membrane repeat protein